MGRKKKKNITFIYKIEAQLSWYIYMQFALDPGRPAHFIRPISSELGDNEKELKQQQQQQQYKKEALQGKTQNPKFFKKKKKKEPVRKTLLSTEREVAGGWIYIQVQVRQVVVVAFFYTTYYENSYIKWKTATMLVDVSTFKRDNNSPHRLS